MKLSDMRRGTTYIMTSTDDEAFLYVITPGTAPVCVLHGEVTELGMSEGSYPVVVQLIGYLVDTEISWASGQLKFFEPNECDEGLSALWAVVPDGSGGDDPAIAPLSRNCEIREVVPPATS